MNITARRRGRLAVGVAVVAGVSLAAAAQNLSGPAKSHGPGWLPRTDNLAVSGSWRGLTAAERTAVEARFAEYERLFVTQDSLMTPRGFTARPAIAGGVSNGPLEVPQFSYSVSLLDGAVRPGDPAERAPSLWVSENPTARDLWIGDSGPPDFRDGTTDIFRERPRSTPSPAMPAHTVVFDGLKFDPSTEARENVVRVLLTADGELPWSDVSRERVLNLLIASAEAEGKDIAQRLGPLAQMNPEFRTQLDQAVALATTRQAQLHAELAAMSATERAMPAWIQMTNQGTYKFAAPGTHGFHHLIADRRDYYRFTGSRVHVRALLVAFRLIEHSGYAGDQIDRAVADSFKAFDWGAAARLLAPAR